MTDLQIRHQANLIELDKLAQERAKLAETKRANLAKEAETARANKTKEILSDLESLAKYGHLKYQPYTLQGSDRKGSAQGVWNYGVEVLRDIESLFPGLSVAKKGR